ncbi:spermidine/putrescine ABC transporter permease [Bacillus sp. B15-48]|uniref:ABC transporter permease n=1 Tax=Bacillus sp. B15-48 TaxID=1548601 RepID=UPI00193F0F2F|nr:spermidine/putrescine ABC transporter permease [Bacillus sp. B15-48]MBM4762964.1 spermidine/putrescine ABC transporter permease [Bacillus sp. B15-48]
MGKINHLKKAFISFCFVGMCLFITLPFFSLLIWSFTKLWPWPELFPAKLSLDSWRYLFSPSGRAFEGLFNSIIIAIITVCFNIVLGFPAARTLSQQAFNGKGLIFALLLSPLFIPMTVSVMGLHHLAIRMDFLPTFVGVVLTHTIITLPYFIVMLWYQFNLLGFKLQEAAKSLGASRWKVFLWVELPLVIPAILVASLLVIVISMSQYLPTWIMSGGTLMTLPLIIFPFANSGNASIVAVYSIWFFVPVIFLVLIYYVLLKWYNKKFTL